MHLVKTVKRLEEAQVQVHQDPTLETAVLAQTDGVTGQTQQVLGPDHKAGPDKLETLKQGGPNKPQGSTPFTTKITNPERMPTWAHTMA
jgi:hypothetical protein